MLESFITLLPYFALSMIGNFAHILTKLATMEEEGNKFTLLEYLSNHKYSIILGVFLAIIGVLSAWGIEELSVTTAILAGFCCDSITKNMLNKNKID